MTLPLSKRETVVFAIVALFLAVVLPALNAAGIIAPFTLNVWGKYLCSRPYQSR